MKGIESPEKEKPQKTNAQRLATFSTEGFDEYDMDAFNRLVKENKLSPGTEIFDLVKKTITEREMSSKVIELQYEGYQILDAFIHCSPEEARTFLSQSFEFTCAEESDYALKSKFFTIVSMYFFSTLSLGGSYEEGNQQLAEQDILVQEFPLSVVMQKLAGNNLLDLDLRKRTGVNPIGIKHSDGTFEINPDMNKSLDAGDKLILLATPVQLRQFNQLISG